MKKNGQVGVFFALLRAGLWEHSVKLSPYGPLDFDAIYRLADDQSVVGLIAAGLEHVEDRRITKPEAISFMKKVFSLEQRNQEMDAFIREIVSKMRASGIYTLLVKGQGIAQCYSRPSWRSSGDVDFFLPLDSYEKAKKYLASLASQIGKEGKNKMHQPMTIGQWVVELHGTLHSGLSFKIDRQLDIIMRSVFHEGNVRFWMNRQIPIPLPRFDEDVIYVFSHILQHFYKGGVGLRQICDWSRLLWTCREKLDASLLESRLSKMGLMSEWKAFGAFAVNYLGMDPSAVPFYSDATKWKRRAERIQTFIMMSGNFGHSRDTSYFQKYPYVLRKTISLSRRVGDLFRHASIFPLDSIRFFPNILYNGLISAARGE